MLDQGLYEALENLEIIIERLKRRSIIIDEHVKSTAKSVLKKAVSSGLKIPLSEADKFAASALWKACLLADYMTSETTWIQIGDFKNIVSFKRIATQLDYYYNL